MGYISGIAFVGMLLAQLITIAHTYVLGVKLSGIGRRDETIESMTNFNASKTGKIMNRLNALKQTIEQHPLLNLSLLITLGKQLPCLDGRTILRLWRSSIRC